MRRIALLVVVALLILLPVRADALTVRDILELTRAGLGDEILLALIDVDRSVFPIDAATLKRLKDAGVSERVIVAMIRSARTPDPLPEQAAVVAPAPAPEPQVIVIEHHDPPQIREVPVAVPVYVPYVRGPFVRRGAHQATVHDSFESFQPPSGLNRPAGAALHTPHVKAPEPVYWGFGGKLRPDAWQPEPDTRVRKKQN
jgi:hypothetical protein